MLSSQLGVSLGKTNYCLHALMEKGWVKIQNFKNSQNKLAYVYILTPSGIEEKTKLTVRYLKSKMKGNVEKAIKRTAKEELLLRIPTAILQAPIFYEPV